MRPDNKKKKKPRSTVHDKLQVVEEGRSKTDKPGPCKGAAKAVPRGPPSTRNAENEKVVSGNQERCEQGNKDACGGTAPEEQQVHDKYAKRKIESNWTKYEIPSSSSSDDEDGEEASMTGPDFRTAIDNSGRCSDAMFRLKAEKEWEQEKQSMFTSELFTIDLAMIGAAVASVPLHLQMGIEDPSALFSENTIMELNSKAAENRREYLRMMEAKEKPDSLEVVTNRLLKTLLSSEPPKSNNTSIEDKIANASTAAQLQADPKNQLIGGNVNIPLTSSSSSNRETKKSSAAEEAVPGTKDLEDWLDDFLQE